MNDKWNPRLRLWNWLAKPSQTEIPEQRTGKSAATQVSCDESLKQDDRTVGTGVVLQADRQRVKREADPEATFRLNVSPSGRVDGVSFRA